MSSDFLGTPDLDGTSTAERIIVVTDRVSTHVSSLCHLDTTFFSLYLGHNVI